MPQLIRGLALLAVVLCLSACASSFITNNPQGLDSIVVTFSPSGDLDAEDVRTVEINEASTIDLWIGALDAVPDLPARGIRYIKFANPSSQHRIEFRKGDEVMRVARMRSGQLDVAAHEGWAFYSGEDEEFTALVNATIPGK